MKLYSFLVLLLLFSTEMYCRLKNNELKKKQDKESTDDDEVDEETTHYLKKNNKIAKSRSKEEFFLFDGDTYTSQQIKLLKYVGNCYIRYNSTIYDLSPLSKVGPFYLKTTEKGAIEFDVCKNVVAKCSHKIKGLVVSDKTSNPCLQFSNRWSYGKKWSWKNAGTDQTSILLEFPEGQLCDKKSKYKVNMDLRCNPHAKVLKLINDGTFDTKACDNTIIAESAYGN